MRIIVNTADRLLTRLLPSATAGACVPENGMKCACINHVLSTYNCTGACIQHPQYCAS